MNARKGTNENGQEGRRGGAAWGLQLGAQRQEGRPGPSMQLLIYLSQHSTSLPNTPLAAFPGRREGARSPAARPPQRRQHCPTSGGWATRLPHPAASGPLCTASQGHIPCLPGMATRVQLREADRWGRGPGRRHCCRMQGGRCNQAVAQRCRQSAGRRLQLSRWGGSGSQGAMVLSGIIQARALLVGAAGAVLLHARHASTGGARASSGLLGWLPLRHSMAAAAQHARVSGFGVRQQRAAWFLRDRARGMAGHTVPLGCATAGHARSTTRTLHQCPAS